MDVLFLKIRVHLQDLIRGPALGDQPDDHADGHAQSTEAWLPPHHARVEGDAVQFRHGQTLAISGSSTGSERRGCSTPALTWASCSSRILWASWVMRMEQNLGPHMEQKRASL